MIFAILGSYVKFSIFYEFFVIFLYFWSKITFSETACPIVKKFDIEVPGDDLYQVYSNHEEICMHVFLGQFFTFLVKKLISLKMLVQVL